jgi:hypothetical protein
MSDLRAQDGMEKMFSSNKTNASWGITVLRHATRAALEAIDGVRVLDTARMRGGGAFIPFGVGSNNTTFGYRLYLGYPVLTTGRAIDHVQLVLLGAGAATLSSNAALTGLTGTLTAGNQYADGLTFALATDATTPKGAGTVIYTAHGSINSPGVFNPADDATAAHLVVPDVFDAPLLVIDGQTGSSATSYNWLFQHGSR